MSNLHPDPKTRKGLCWQFLPWQPLWLPAGRDKPHPYAPSIRGGVGCDEEDERMIRCFWIGVNFRRAGCKTFEPFDRERGLNASGTRSSPTPCRPRPQNTGARQSKKPRAAEPKSSHSSPGSVRTLSTLKQANAQDLARQRGHADVLTTEESLPKEANREFLHIAERHLNSPFTLITLSPRRLDLGLLWPQDPKILWREEGRFARL